VRQRSSEIERRGKHFSFQRKEHFRSGKMPPRFQELVNNERKKKEKKKSHLV
jgi:hypothetical protein